MASINNIRQRVSKVSQTISKSNRRPVVSAAGQARIDRALNPQKDLKVAAKLGKDAAVSKQVK